MTGQNWSNQDNVEYYEKVTYEKQQGFSVIGGLDVFSDLKLLDHYIKKSRSIFEIGAGYGRVIDYLLEMKFEGRITAIERSYKFFKILQDKYQNSVNLIHGDINKFRTEKQFDLILWVWSGISDFSRREQPNIIKKLAGLLAPLGTLIIDSVSHTIKPINVQCSDFQNYILDITQAKLQGYIPSPEDMQEYAEKSKLQITYEPYKTSTDRPRAFYILQNQ